MNSASLSKKVHIIGTGGTIASYVDYETGAVKPLKNAQDILYAQPELGGLGDISAEILFNKFSEDMEKSDWITLARSIHDKIREGIGIVVAHGTDTLSFASSAISFLIENPKAPIVFTASQRSSDRPSSDAYFNLLGAVKTATSDLGEVGVVMHSSTSDNELAIHSGVKVRKMHTSKRDAFRSINSDVLGYVDKKLEVRWKAYKKINDSPMTFYERMSDRVSLLYFYPGMSNAMLDYALRDNDGLIIAGTGLGHLSNGFLKDIKRLVSSGKIIGMTSQCLYGSVNMNVYSTGRNLLEAGVIPLGDMLPEVAYTKLSFLLGNFGNQEARDSLNKNLRGELSATRKE